MEFGSLKDLTLHDITQKAGRKAPAGNLGIYVECGIDGLMSGNLLVGNLREFLNCAHMLMRPFELQQLKSPSLRPT